MSIRMSQSEMSRLSQQLEEKLSVQEEQLEEDKYKIIFKSPEIEKIEEFLVEFYSKNVQYLGHANQLKTLEHMSLYASQNYGVYPLSSDPTRKEKIEFIESILQSTEYQNKASAVPACCQKFITPDNIVDGHQGALMQMNMIMVGEGQDFPEGLKMIVTLNESGEPKSSDICHITFEETQVAKNELFEKYQRFANNMGRLERRQASILSRLNDLCSLSQKYDMQEGPGALEKIADGRLLNEILAKMTGHCLLEFKSPAEYPELGRLDIMKNWRALRMAMSKIMPQAAENYDLHIPDDMNSPKDLTRIIFFFLRVIENIVNGCAMGGYPSHHLLSKFIKSKLKFDEEKDTYTLPFSLDDCEGVDGEMDFRQEDDEDQGSISSSASLSSRNSSYSQSSQSSRSSKRSSHRSDRSSVSSMSSVASSESQDSRLSRKSSSHRSSGRESTRRSSRSSMSSAMEPKNEY